MDELAIRRAGGGEGSLIRCNTDAAPVHASSTDQYLPQASACPSATCWAFKGGLNGPIVSGYRCQVCLRHTIGIVEVVEHQQL